MSEGRQDRLTTTDLVVEGEGEGEGEGKGEGEGEGDGDGEGEGEGGGQLTCSSWRSGHCGRPCVWGEGMS